MFVRTAHWHCKPEFFDEAPRLFKTGALPILSRQSGLLWAQLVGHSNDTLRIAITVWRDEASYRKYIDSEDNNVITRIFEHMYVDGHSPVGFDLPVLHEHFF